MQPLLLHPRTVDPFVVLKATGELDLHTQDVFEREVSRLLDTSPVVVDLSGLDFLAISALKSLMVCHCLAGLTGHVLFYAEPSQQALRLLSLSGLDLVLSLTASVAEVIRSADSEGVDPVPAVAGSTAPGGFVDQSARDFPQLDIG